MSDSHNIVKPQSEFVKTADQTQRTSSTVYTTGSDHRDGPKSFTPDQLPRLFEDLARQHFFGALQFNFRDGRVVLVRREETTVVTDHRGEAPREYSTPDSATIARR